MAPWEARHSRRTRRIRPIAAPTATLPAPISRPLRALAAAAREARRWPSLLTVALSLVVGIPAAIALTPDQELVSLGQPLSVGARAPDLSLSGPAQLVQVGNTELDIPKLRVWGPLRPRLTLGPVQRTPEAAQALAPGTTRQVTADAAGALVAGFARWYGWAALCLLVITAAICAGVGYARVLLVLRRQHRRATAGAEQLTATEVWQHSVGALRRTAGLALLVSALAWAACGALAYQGAMHGLRTVGSLSDLVGTYRVSPSPVGPPVFGYSGAVIGDSRATLVGGPPVAEPSPTDVSCGRSSDSLAAELERLLSARVLNLACPSATVAEGLRGPQQRGDQLLPPQLGLLKQARDLDFVVVVIGPNDVGWSDFLRYCYGATNCSDNLSQGEFDYRLAAFDREYGELLADLDQLPDRPKVVVVNSYRVLEADARCPDVRGRPPAVGLDPVKIELLNQRNDQLNSVLGDGARKYGFAVATPALTTLCAPDTDGLGPDLRGLDDPFPFHPTGLGSLRMAASVAPLIADPTPQPPR
ncbi:MAG: GDSL-type esterase/lipase family protein [Pseudonocardia sp.]